jgi:hypothetical protein
MLDSGFRISDLNNIPVNGKDGKFKNRIALDNTYLLSYAHTVYGINYNKHNYKIPLMSIRDDIKGYIGVESLVAPWSEQLKLWHGSWNNPSIRNKSYVYQWTDADKLHEHYAPKKFEDKENSYFIIKDAPYPFESADRHNRDNGEIAANTLEDGTVITVNMPIAAEDPHTDTNKIVTKSYIDERLAGERIVEVKPTFAIRDYECTYIIRSKVLQEAERGGKTATIKILYPEKFEDRICHNKLKFTLMLEGKKGSDDFYDSSLVNNPNWIIQDSAENEIPIVWLNDGKNEKPDVTKELYYDNAQYLIIRFESITNKLSYKSIKETIENQKVIVGHKVTPDYGVFALCENVLYRSTGIKTCNKENGKDIEGQRLYIESKDKSVNITSKREGTDIHVDLEVPQYNIISSNNSVIVSPSGTFDKVFDLTVVHPDIVIPDIEIPEIPSYFQTVMRQLSGNQINLSQSYNTKYYYTGSASSLSINFITSGLASYETVTAELLYKSTVDSTISGKLNQGTGFSWVSAIDNSVPILKANRLYQIEFTYYPTLGNIPARVYARIKWFKQL